MSSIRGGLYCIFTIVSCAIPNKKESDTDFDPKQFSFFVAGHVYGDPFGNNPGLHEPFEQKFSLINIDSTMTFGFLTGDMVRTSHVAAWDILDSQLSQLKVPVYFVAGNHDIASSSERGIFSERYGPTYFRFSHNSYLFIVLDSTLDMGRITHDQWDFFIDSLIINQEIKGIFILFHHVIWKRPDNMFRDVNTNNSLDFYSLNFWPDLVPALKHLDVDVYLFAGDVGALKGKDAVHYYEDDNLHFIASGMGGGDDDNFLIVKIVNDNIIIDLVELGKNQDKSLGSLEDHLIKAAPFYRSLYTFIDVLEIFFFKIYYKISKLLGPDLLPGVDIQEGIRRTFAWFKSLT